MPNYTFRLHGEMSGLSDMGGVSLPDRDGALAYARGVVGELMRGREIETRFWCLDVYEGETEKVFALSFASLDPTLNHLRPDLRAMVETLCGRRMALAEAFHDVEDTVRESKALMARARGKLYVAARSGEKTSRDK